MRNIQSFICLLIGVFSICVSNLESLSKRTYGLFLEESTGKVSERFYFLMQRSFYGMNPLRAIIQYDDEESDYFIIQNCEKMVLNIRDLRDACVAQLFYFQECVDGGEEHDTRIDEQLLNNWNSYTFDQKLAIVINGEFFPFSSFALSARFASELKNSTVKRCEIVNFENFSGLNGLENQKSSIENIYNFLNFSFTQRELQRACSSISSVVLEDYEIPGVWSTYFSEENKILFKEKLGSYLIDLGYEIDDNW
jgi:hypothetical protein